MRSLSSKARTISVILIGVLFVLAGINHFVQPDVYTKIMPPYLPVHLTLVYVSGFFEILGGVGVWNNKLRRVAGRGLIALLIAVFPSNVHMLFNAADFPTIPYWALLVRLPLQLVLIVWVWWATERSVDLSGPSGKSVGRLKFSVKENSHARDRILPTDPWLADTLGGVGGEA